MRGFTLRLPVARMHDPRWTFRHSDLPLSWRVYGRDDSRNYLVLGPIWFYPFWLLWLNRWRPVAWLVSRGWLWVDVEGGYYRTARPAWYWRWKLAPALPWFDQPDRWWRGLTAWQVYRKRVPATDVEIVE